MSIVEKLKSNRSTLSESSLKTYNSILSNLYKKVFPDDKEIDIKKFSQYKKFLAFLNSYESSKRKTYLSALTVLCPDVENYRELMNQDGKKYNDEQKNQEKTQKQKDNWVEQDELNNIFNLLETEANQLYKLKNLSMTDLQKIQNYIILCLVSGKFINIRRSLDWTEMKIKNYTDEDNFLKKNEFTFNKYKTARFKQFGEQTVELPKPLYKIIKKWLKINPTNYLLFDSQKDKLTPTKLTQRLNKILGKKASINILRHSFLSDKYKNMPSLNELEDEAKEMGHSLKEHLEYIKK